MLKIKLESSQILCIPMCTPMYDPNCNMLASRAMPDANTWLAVTSLHCRFLASYSNFAAHPHDPVT